MTSIQNKIYPVLPRQVVDFTKTEPGDAWIRALRARDPYLLIAEEEFFFTTEPKEAA